MSSKRHLRRKQCEGKNRYVDQTQAVRVCIHVQKTRGEVVHPYKCPFGNHWHIGHRRTAFAHTRALMRVAREL